MDQEKLNDWEGAIDHAQDVDWTRDLPKGMPAGFEFKEPTQDAFRKWKYVRVIAGKPGARWAYWQPWFITRESHHRLPDVLGVGPHPEFHVVVDTIFNGDSPNFIGMLGLPFTGKIAGEEQLAWVLISPRFIPIPEPHLYEEKPRERYERSREVYDVDTQKSHTLPGRPGSDS